MSYLEQLFEMAAKEAATVTVLYDPRFEQHACPFSIQVVSRDSKKYVRKIGVTADMAAMYALHQYQLAPEALQTPRK